MKKEIYTGNEKRQRKERYKLRKEIEREKRERYRGSEKRENR